MATIFDGFGHLRSLLNQPTLTDADAKRLMTYIGIAYRTDVERYKQEWLPYIKGFAHHFGDDFATLTSLDDLTHACDMLPFARWRLHIDDQDFGDDDALTLADMPELGAVSSLWLYWVWIKAQGARALAKAPQLSGVRHLRFGGEFLSEDALSALLLSTYLGSLDVLELWAPDVYDDDWVDALVRSSCVNHVRELILGVTLWIEGPRDLNRSDIFQRLQSLEMFGGGLDADDLAQFVETPWFNRLRRFELSNNLIGAQFMKVLCQRRSPSELVTLSLTEGELSDDALLYFDQPHVFGHLKSLDISLNEIGPTSVEALVSSVVFAQLESLDWSHNPIGDDGVDVLIRASARSSLKVLNLRCCDLTDAAAVALAKDARFPALARVDLAGNSISPQGIEVLKASTTWTAHIKVE